MATPRLYITPDGQRAGGRLRQRDNAADDGEVCATAGSDCVPEPVKAGTLDSERRARDRECSRNARTRGAPMYVLLVPPDPPWVKKPVDKKNWVPREVKL